MKKSIIIIIAASVATLGGAGGGVAYYLTHKPHVHTFEDTWSYNDSRHWRTATCEHTTLTYDNTNHVMNEWTVKTAATCGTEGAEARACSVCGYKEVRSVDKTDHTYATEWSMDESGHWHASTCEHTTEKTETIPHTYNYGERVCNVCEYLDNNPRGTELKVQNDIIDVSKIITIPNQTSVFSINSLLQVAENASYTLYSDYSCTQAISSGTMVLAEGDNTFYVKVQNGGIKDIYSITLHRNRLYTVTFDTAGGTDVEAQTVEENSVLTTPPTTERTGYTFSAWDYDFSQPVTSDITAMASWTANSYILTFDADGGTVESSGLAVAYDSVCNLPTPTKNGYVFDGWYNGEAKLTSGFTWQATSDVELKAKWTAKTYKVSFTDGKGVCTQTQISVTYDSEFELPRNLSLTGYTFAGWFNGETEITDGVWTYDTITSLTAKWTANTYTVNFDANGGQCETTEKTATYGEPCYYPQPTRTGYTFVGWYKDTVEMGLYGTPSWDEANGAALTAKWEAKTYQITLTDPKGVCKTSEVYVTYDASYTLPGDLSFTGYTFDGWYADDVKIDAEVWESDTITVLTAKWTANTYTLTFDANDGECTTAEMTVTFDKDETLPTPTYYGYVFQGWYYGENAENKLENGKWNITSDLTLTAKWKIDENVRYQVFHYQQNITDDEYTLVDTEEFFGMSFASVTPALKTYDGFTAKQTVKTVEIEPDGSSVVKYYYDRNTVTVTFVTNNGQASVQKSFRYDYPANSAFVPERQWVTFGGWYTDAALTTPAPNLTQDTTLYAYWEGEAKPGDFTYTVTNDKVTLTVFSGKQTNVVIPAYINDYPVTEIAQNCFFVTNRYDEITDVTIPETITKIGPAEFSYCELDTFNVRDIAAYCAICFEDNYNHLQNVKAFCVNGEPITDLVIPDGVTAIADYVFACSTVFTSVTFPKTLQTIGKYAFYNCTALQNVTFERGTQCTTIGKCAFANCSALHSFIIPASVTTTHSNAFQNCPNLTVYCRVAKKPAGWDGTWTQSFVKVEWDYSTTFYRVEHYHQNTENDEYTLFESETYKADDIFNATPAVHSYTGFVSPSEKTVELPVKETTVIKYYYDRNTYTVTFDANNGTAVDSIEVKYGQSFTLPTSTRTGYSLDGWFDGTTKVQSGTWSYTEDKTLTAKWTIIKNVLSFNADGGNCGTASMTVTYFEEYELPTPTRTGYEFLGWFDGDTQLTDGTWAGTSDLSLTAKWNVLSFAVTFVSNGGSAIPASSIAFNTSLSSYVPVRENFTFGGWYSDVNLTSKVLTVPSEAVTLYARWNEETATSLFTYTIDGDAVTVNKYVGSDATVAVPSFIGDKPVTSIGNYAFNNCKSISSITFPESVTTVGNSVFYFCQGLTSFTVPKNLTAISAGMFWNCSSLKSVTFAEGSKCSSIGETAFKYCKNLTEIVIPNTVLSIGNNAFEECTSLPYVIIPSSVTTVGAKIFYSDSQVYVYCEAASKPAGWDSYWCKYKYDPYYYDRTPLFYVSLPSGQIVWKFADKVRLDFETNGGNALSFVTLTKGADLSGITPSRAGYTFDGWYADPDMQTQVTAAPNQSTTLYAKWAGETAPSLFSYTETDDSVTITKYNGTKTEVGIPTCVNGKKVTAIANEAFMNTAVVSVTIPNGVTTVGARAFCGCSVLTNVTFLSQSCCTSIGQSAFKDCTSLSSITIPLSVATIGKEVFAGDEGMQIYCHATAKPEGWDTDWLVGATDATVTWDCADAHTVSFITNGGEALAPASIKYGASPADYTPVRAGCSFGGWYLDAGLKTAASAIPDRDTTVYARWNEETATSLFTYTESNTAVTVTKYNGSETNVVVPAFIGDKPVCEIGAEAFKNNAAVVSVSIPTSVKVIGDYAFYGCSALNTFTFAEGSLCTTVWSYAFQGCSSLCAITLPDTVWQFGYYSFAGCTSLSSFTVPAEVIDLDKGMFSGDTNLTTVTFAAGSKCAVIGEKAFSGCTKLTTLVIPDAVKEIQKYAFENCTSLSSIVIPISVTTIGTHILYGVGGVQVHCVAEDMPSGWDNNWCAYDSSNTHLPDNQIEWAYGFDKYQVTFVTNGGSAIASRPYKEGRDLTKFVPTRTGYTFDGWYTDIGLTVDISAVGTEDVTVYAKWEGETNTSLFTYAESDGRVTVTAYTGTETNVVVPAYINGSPVCEIGAEAFKNTAVISVYVSGLVEAIGDCAFSGCTALSAFNIPLTTALSTIGSGAFDGCTSLSEFVIPASVTTVGAIVFSGVSGISIHCKALEQPEGWNNQWLNGASDATVSWGWVETYAVSFVTNGGDALPSVALPYGSTLSSYEPTRTGFTFGGWYTDVGLKTPFSTVGLVPVTVYARWNEETSTSFFSYTVSDGKVTITKFNDPNATNDGKSIKNVSIPAYIGGYPVTDIGAKAFVIDAPQNVIYQSRITSLTLPETLVNIGDAAFKYCRNITAVTIPASVLVIGDRAFAECNSLKTFAFAEGTALTHIWSFAFEKCYALTAIDLPDTVIQLGDYTFAECTSLTSIRIPAGVKLIHSGMFYKDTNLKTITFAEGFAPSAIGHDAFNNCTSLTAIEIPTSVKTIEYSAFSGCSSLTSIVIPNGVSSIEDGVFSGCSSLASVSLPNTVTVIKVGVFNGCTSLVSIELPHSLTEIQSSAFYGCTSLSSFVLPNSVTGIGNTIFKNCTSLSSFVFEEGAKCSYIGSNVFENCTSLSSIVLSDCITYQLGDRIFYGCSDNLIIYCEFDSKPSGWLSNWNVYKGSSERIPESQIVWGYTGEES